MYNIRMTYECADTDMNLYSISLKNAVCSLYLGLTMKCYVQLKKV